MITLTQQALNLIGLSLRAKQQISGEALVLQAIRQKKAKLVLLANDAGSNLQKEITNKCHYYQVALSNTLSTAQLTQAIGRPRTVIAITNDGFAKKLITLLNA
ncbi:MAG: YlxQ-related RNA-binding protein [Candidatus Paralactobacillus gallistercoris]|uniref:YlxQ-related RNA-binding protein n=1 Tax=Candidatus Paralactobacillus gallistercoris TaxID=2838724 RepID=A0A948TJ67_9LACO|nr:YlxQ-related RNA-binding protein [Candidatus Paralactobacillus gallistercoris]